MEISLLTLLCPRRWYLMWLTKSERHKVASVGDEKLTNMPSFRILSVCQ